MMRMKGKFLCHHGAWVIILMNKKKPDYKPCTEWVRRLKLGPKWRILHYCVVLVNRQPGYRPITAKSNINMHHNTSII